MMRENNGRMLRLRLIALAALVLAAGSAGAVTLPPPPVSPAPVTDYEYDAKGNLTKVVKAKGTAGFGFTPPRMPMTRWTGSRPAPMRAMVSRRWLTTGRIRSAKSRTRATWSPSTSATGWGI
jgi:hypothetical protein